VELPGVACMPMPPLPEGTIAELAEGAADRWPPPVEPSPSAAMVVSALGAGASDRPLAAAGVALGGADAEARLLAEEQGGAELGLSPGSAPVGLSAEEWELLEGLLEDQGPAVEMG
jgi:hypothetical protein